jgi:SAM-dependent methyltransferase
MIAQARRLAPGVDFRQGDMLTLDDPEETWAGLAAIYSMIHIPRDEMARALMELRRVLGPGGILLLAFHSGDDVLHLDEG